MCVFFIFNLFLVSLSLYVDITYLHCQVPPSTFCRGRYRNFVDWLIDFRWFHKFKYNCLLTKIFGTPITKSIGHRLISTMGKEAIACTCFLSRSTSNMHLVHFKAKMHQIWSLSCSWQAYSAPPDSLVGGEGGLQSPASRTPTPLLPLNLGPWTSAYGLGTQAHGSHAFFFPNLDMPVHCRCN